MGDQKMQLALNQEQTNPSPHLSQRNITGDYRTQDTPPVPSSAWHPPANYQHDCSTSSTARLGSFSWIQAILPTLESSKPKYES